ncbi:MAG: enoyl-CoA hydratase [Chloroflexi bacterium]|jgi:enoyl-CoA hydratase|nr:enoyl-CoA hydratase [Chloroflexota bacterium]MBT3670127.1 enoyl-CoA hydratase [Chloroflexota bacterium]MBT4003972.1 enoyl-CoA hydratase [Chloroflexota bacterium]MBT4306671.1 enoyl-CoA hydratase [Chloroflexota bacterium]MBT4533013.1 enoyl-CoA hydratase [Chloroflexota bacterium]
MTEYSSILVETRENVGLIRLNRPRAFNALNTELITELVDALQKFDQQDGVGAIVITGNDKVFAAGADIKEMAESTVVDRIKNDSIAILSKIRQVKKPIIAAISGWALGGGCELAMACDMIIASETAQFGQPEINLGVIPGAGGTQRLTRIVGKAIAMEMILNDRRLTAEEALQMGLINRVVPVEIYLEETLKMAQEIAVRAPIAVQFAKKAINQAYESSLSDGLEDERQAFYLLFGTEDQKEGMRAFSEKRPPKWQGK